MRSCVVEGFPEDLLASTPERAFLELLDEVPARAEFQAVLPIVRQLEDLDPRRLGDDRPVRRILAVQHPQRVALQPLDAIGGQALPMILQIGNEGAKVKRLALWFGDHLGLPWAARLDRRAIDLGRGNRVLTPGGRLDAAYGITVPRDLVRP